MSPPEGQTANAEASRHSLHELLAMVMHELRAPLSSLTITAELLLTDSERLDPKETQKLLRRIQRNTAWLQALVENLTVAAQLEVSQLQLRWDIVELREALDMALVIVQPSLDREGQRVTSMGIDDIQVRGDARRIEQVLVNLLMNASKYGRPDSEIGVTVASTGECVRIEVRDAGPGIPRDEHDRIFQRYVRGSSALESGSGGLGLGLHIVKILVELHGGSVGVASELGAGATFWFTLPTALNASATGGESVWGNSRE